MRSDIFGEVSVFDADSGAMLPHFIGGPARGGRAPKLSPARLHAGDAVFFLSQRGNRINAGNTATLHQIAQAAPATGN
nr:hypothetical protein [Marinicella sp. W31]MDC2880197.1 hypothetical protein [Marinicella sp. W31]